MKPINAIAIKLLLRRSFTSTNIWKGPIDEAFKGVNYDFASITPADRTYVRQPIIINGAGPAGLILAIGLKNARIPFEICEKHRHDLPTRLRRNHVSYLMSDILKPLREILRVPNSRSILDEIALDPPSFKRLIYRPYDDHPIETEKLMEFLRRRVRVNYGYRLEIEGISCLESVVTSRYNFGDKIRTFEGSLLVGADGIFSAVRRTYNVYIWPAITYVSTIVVSRERYNSEFEGLLNESRSTSLLIGNTRLSLMTSGKTFSNVHISLWYSRMAASDEDYHALFGLQPDESDTPRVDYKFDAMIGAEIDSLQPLPPPFAAAYELCKSISVSQKWRLNSVRMGRNELATDVFSDGLSMPAVLVGNAARSIPEILSPTDISWVILDAMDLCYMIVERYEDDRLFSRISDDFYAIKFHRWEKLLRKWVEKWTSAHGLPFDSLKARSTWTKLARVSRERQVMPESEFKNLPDGDARAIQFYKEREKARWGVIQMRIRERLEKRKHAHKIPKGVEPSKLVLRYIDSSSSRSRAKGKQQSAQDHGPSGMGPSDSSLEDVQSYYCRFPFTLELEEEQ